MTYISNNLAVRLSIGVLQRKWRMHGLGALSNANSSTSKLVAYRITCFYGNSKDVRQMGLFFNSLTAISSVDSFGKQIIWFVWSLLHTDPHFQFVLPSDFCSHTFTRPDNSFDFPLSNLSHILYTSLFLSFSFALSFPISLISFRIGWHNPDLSLVSNRGIHLMWK